MTDQPAPTLAPPDAPPQGGSHGIGWLFRRILHFCGWRFLPVRSRVALSCLLIVALVILGGLATGTLISAGVQKGVRWIMNVEPLIAERR